MTWHSGTTAARRRHDGSQKACTCGYQKAFLQSTRVRADPYRGFHRNQKARSFGKAPPPVSFLGLTLEVERAPCNLQRGDLATDRLGATAQGKDVAGQPRLLRRSRERHGAPDHRARGHAEASCNIRCLGRLQDGADVPGLSAPFIPPRSRLTITPPV